MWEITREFEIAIAHHLEGYEGACCNNHGHNIVGEVTLIGDKLNDIGIMFDLKELSVLVKEYVENELDHKDLNKILSFNPTMELLSAYIFALIKEGIKECYPEYLDIQVKEVVLKESSKSKVKYYEV